MANATERAIRKRIARERDASTLAALQRENNRLHAENARLRETRSFALSQAALRRASVNRATVTIERRDIAGIDTHNANRNAARHSNVIESTDYSDAW